MVAVAPALPTTLDAAPVMDIAALLQAACSSISHEESQQRLCQRLNFDKWLFEAANDPETGVGASAPRRPIAGFSLGDNEKFNALRNIHTLFLEKAARYTVTRLPHNDPEGSPLKKARLTASHEDRATSPLHPGIDFALDDSLVQPSTAKGSLGGSETSVTVVPSPCRAPIGCGRTTPKRFSPRLGAEEAAIKSGTPLACLFAAPSSPSKRKKAYASEQPHYFGSSGAASLCAPVNAASAALKVAASRRARSVEAVETPPSSSKYPDQARGPVRQLGVSASAASLATVPGTGRQRAPELALAGAAAAFAQPSWTGLEEQTTSPLATPRVCQTWQSNGLFAKHPTSPTHAVQDECGAKVLDHQSTAAPSTAPSASSRSLLSLSAAPSASSRSLLSLSAGGSSLSSATSLQAIVARSSAPLARPPCVSRSSSSVERTDREMVSGRSASASAAAARVRGATTRNGSSLETDPALFAQAPLRHKSGDAEGSGCLPSPRLPDEAVSASSRQGSTGNQVQALVKRYEASSQQNTPIAAQASPQVSSVRSNIHFFETRSSSSLKAPASAPSRTSASRGNAGGQPTTPAAVAPASNAGASNGIQNELFRLSSDNREHMPQETALGITTRVADASEGIAQLPAKVVTSSASTSRLPQVASTANNGPIRFRTSPAMPVSSAQTIHATPSSRDGVRGQAKSGAPPASSTFKMGFQGQARSVTPTRTVTPTKKPAANHGEEKSGWTSKTPLQGLANLVGNSGPSTFLNSSVKSLSEKETNKAQNTDAYERLASGHRREDLAKPKSLKAAEQARLQEDRRQRERQEREQERDRSRAALASALDSLASKSGAQPPRKAFAENREFPQSSSKNAGELRSVVSQLAPPAGIGGGKSQTHQCSASADYPEQVPTQPVTKEALDSAAAAANANAYEDLAPLTSLLPFPLCTDIVPRMSLPQPWMLLRRIKLDPKNPEDNYEMSEGGTSDDEQHEKKRVHKKIPNWSENFLDLLAKQESVDPDTIFASRVPRCSLEEVFPEEMYREVGKSRPKRQRGSSGDWRRDGLGADEVENYKTRMGHAKTWESELGRVAPSCSG